LAGLMSARCSQAVSMMLCSCWVMMGLKVRKAG
jgi:hypothetical protein